MARLIPSRFQLRADQRQWLKVKANQKCEGSESRLIRRLVDAAMKADKNKKAA